MTCSKCNGTGNYVTRAGRNAGTCWQCNGAGTTGVVFSGYRGHRLGGLTLGVAAFAIGLGALSLVTFAAAASRPAAPSVITVQLDSAAITAAVRAAMPVTAAPAPVAAAPAPAAPVAAAPAARPVATAKPAKAKVKRKAKPAPRPAPVVVYHVVPRCGCGG